MTGTIISGTYTTGVTLTNANWVLTIGALGGFSAIIGNFDAADEIILPGVSIVSSGFNASSHVLTLQSWKR